MHSRGDRLQKSPEREIKFQTFADPAGGQISLLDTIREPNATDPQAEIDAAELKGRLAESIEALPDRAAPRQRPLLLREPDPARDR